MSATKGAKTASQEAYARGFVIANRFKKNVIDIIDSDNVRVKKLTDANETLVEGGTAGDVVDTMKTQSLVLDDLKSKAEDIARLFDSKIAGMSSLKGQAGASQEATSSVRAAASNLKK